MRAFSALCAVIYNASVNSCQGSQVIALPFALPRDGTTDVTRTMHFGTPSAYEKVFFFLIA